MPSTESLALSMQLGSRNSIPWKGVQVIVTKLWHHRKGDLAVVTNVLCNQDTPSGLKVEVLFSKYNPSGPVPISLFDYDDVVEYRYGYIFFSFSAQMGLINTVPKNLWPTSVSPKTFNSVLVNDRLFLPHGLIVPILHHSIP
jgi:hypothetical protein